MTEVRQFARFRPTAELERMVFSVPTDGLCLSTFLVIRPPGHPERALLGHINSEGPWGHIGAIDPSRAKQWMKGWMLPSSQLIYYETPESSARRIAREQLGIELGDLPTARLMSDSEQRPSAAKGDLHWDIGFVYVTDAGSPAPPKHPAWTDLQYVEIAKTRSTDYVRSQQDVLKLVGLSPSD
jgi:ADP-ribose pyrophosphatase YjhB (NUDIX family)